MVQMPPFYVTLFLRTLITQNLKLKSHNKIVGYDLLYFIYARAKNMTFQLCFGCHQELVKMY